jgi:hypothetical protein
MSDENFATYVQRERDCLNAEREAVLIQQRELDRRLAEINKEFQAIDAYEAAKRCSGRSYVTTRCRAAFSSSDVNVTN